ncbi:MAG: diphthine--ammonia ligase [Dehalococcoidales bacterium]|nr:diphthine--ammonia ligase [Dehalococcoidales bacterium]
METVFTSWSGGKDCCLACYRAIAGGHKVRCLLNMVSEGGKRSYSHGLSPRVLEAQSQAIGIPLIQQQAKRENYEAEFKRVLLSLKDKGVSGGVFGDIDLDEHRRWIERVCADVAITPHLPLWGEEQGKLLEELIGLGFTAVVVAAKAELFGREWLGQTVDRDFLDHLEVLNDTKEVTPCGEAGEYHTLVIDGPLFRKRLKILRSRRVLREGRWFLSILEVGLGDKPV